MQIRSTSNIQTSSAVNLQKQNSTNATQNTNSVPVDSLEISAEAQMLSTSGATDIRADRVADLRAQIASGEYETPEKLEAAVATLAEETKAQAAICT
ncbi:MAG: flagellar biosynthesis anti-sigma factor FlgM, partial [Mariniblastus sp.]